MVLMCDQGQTNGIILRNAPPETRRLYTSDLHVLFTDGRIEWIEADRKGILSTNLVPAARFFDDVAICGVNCLQTASG